MDIRTPVPQDNQDGQTAAFAPGLTPAAPISPQLPARDFARRIGGQQCLSSEAQVRKRGAQKGLPAEAPKRKRGAQAGNRNAVRHGGYSRKRAESFRRVFAESGYGGIDLEIVLAMWHMALFAGGLPNCPEALRDGSFGRVCALVRQKYGLPRRGAEDDLAAYFLRLCLDLVVTPPLQQSLAAAIFPVVPKAEG